MNFFISNDFLYANVQAIKCSLKWLKTVSGKHLDLMGRL